LLAYVLSFSPPFCQFVRLLLGPFALPKFPENSSFPQGYFYIKRQLKLCLYLTRFGSGLYFFFPSTPALVFFRPRLPNSQVASAPWNPTCRRPAAILLSFSLVFSASYVVRLPKFSPPPSPRVGLMRGSRSAKSLNLFNLRTAPDLIGPRQKCSTIPPFPPVFLSRLEHFKDYQAVPHAISDVVLSPETARFSPLFFFFFFSIIENHPGSEFSLLVFPLLPQTLRPSPVLTNPCWGPPANPVST